MKPAKATDNRAAGGRAERVTAARLVEHGRQVGQRALSFGDSVESLLCEAEAFVRGGLQRNPYATLGAAAAVGFVVAGGLGGRLLGTIALISGRAFAGAALQSAVIRALVPAGDHDASPSEPDKEKP